MESTVREVRLKPEFAHLYPGLTPGVWENAATVAEHLARRSDLAERVGEKGRVLSGEHFDFRGGPVSAVPRRGARSRTTDVDR